VAKVITPQTKIIAFSLITNTIGDLRDGQAICALAKDKGIYTIVDAAQAIAHYPIDVKTMNCDFLFYSGHKIYGPTGIGILFAKTKHLEKLQPVYIGGGTSKTIALDGQYVGSPIPFIFEAGTPNIAGAIGLRAALEYVSKIGLKAIHAYETELKDYAISKLATLDNLEIYNKTIKGSIIIFNFKGIFSQDVGSYLNAKGIAVRSGDFCAKLLNNKPTAKVMVRAVFCFYNTKAEIDHLFASLENRKPEDLLDIFFE